MSAPEPRPFEIVGGDGGETVVGTNGSATATIFAAEGGRLFRRRGVTLNCATGSRASTEWIVAELDGVRAYFDGETVVLTRRDLNP